MDEDQKAAHLIAEPSKPSGSGSNPPAGGGGRVFDRSVVDTLIAALREQGKQIGSMLDRLDHLRETPIEMAQLREEVLGIRESVDSVNAKLDTLLERLSG